LLTLRPRTKSSPPSLHDALPIWARLRRPGRRYRRHMPRKPRAFEAGAYYHVGSRGNNGEAIVRDDIDRMEFSRWYARVANTERWGVLAYVLMDNHYHFVVRSDESGLSRGMQLLNCGFTRRINRRHGRDGHLSANGFTAAGSRTTSICSRPAATSSS